MGGTQGTQGNKRKLQVQRDLVEKPERKHNTGDLAVQVSLLLKEIGIARLTQDRTPWHVCVNSVTLTIFIPEFIT